MDQPIRQTGAALQRPARVMWLWWVLATTVGWVVLLTLGWRVGWRLGESLVGSGQVGAGVGLLVGAVILGAAQWLVLRPEIPRAGWWVLATVVGVGAGMIVGFLVGGAVPAPEFVGALATGVALGVAQWLVLRPAVPRAGWWVLATVGGLVAGFLLSLLVGPVAGERGVGGVIADAVGGLVYGVVTGLAWLWMVQAAATAVGARRAAP